MRETAIKLTSDLRSAFKEVTGLDADSAEPDIVVVAAYLDLLAKEYGLTESTDLDTDPVERTQQIDPVMKVVARVLGTPGAPLNGDALRSKIYVTVLELAADAEARAELNRNQPLTEFKVLHLAQIYWNLEANDVRPKLPIRPSGDRDIPVSTSKADYATMKWTDRVNQKGANRSSGQSFRTQGARLTVLIAKQCMASDTGRSRRSDLVVRPTSDPEQPLEVTVKSLAERAATEGRFHDAFDLASAHLMMTTRRAEQAPFDFETELAEAHLMRGFFSLWRSPIEPLANGGWQFGKDEAFESIEDLESAAASFELQQQLSVDDEELAESTQNALLSLGLAYASVGRWEESAEVLERLEELRKCRVDSGGVDGQRSWFDLLIPSTVAWVLERADRPADASAVARRGADVALHIMQDGFDLTRSEFGLVGNLCERLGSLGLQDDRVNLAAARVEWLSAKEPLIADSDEDETAWHFLAMQELWEAQNEAGRHIEAARTARKLTASAGRTDEPEPGDSKTRMRIAYAHWMARTSLGSAGRAQESLDAAEQIVNACQPEEAPTKEDVAWLRTMAMALASAASDLQKSERLESAALGTRRAVEMLTQCARLEPPENNPVDGVAWHVLVNLCLQAASMNDEATATSAARMLLETPVPREFPDTVVGLYELDLLTCANEFERLGQTALAIELLSVAFKTLESRQLEGDKSHALPSATLLVHVQLRVLLEAAGNDAEVDKLDRAMEELIERFPEQYLGS